MCFIRGHYIAERGTKYFRYCDLACVSYGDLKLYEGVGQNISGRVNLLCFIRRLLYIVGGDNMFQVE